MAGDDDLARLLPEPPPARPAGRAAAIAAAMRRFDGEPEPRPVRAPSRAWIGWRPAGALASVLLVAVIGIPIALQHPGGPVATAPRPAPDAPPQMSEARPAQPVMMAPVEPAARADRPVLPADPVVKRTATPAAPAEEVAAELPPPPAYTPSPSEPEPAPAPPAAMAQAPLAKRAEIAGSGAPAKAAGTEAGDVVVTGARMRRPGTAVRRGDWNACTVNDPKPSLRDCRRLTDRAAKGAAAERLSAGLALAWQHDWDGAVVAFDAAIALQPRLAFAYLNRGLVRQRQGNIGQAATDLDLAVRYAPQAPRGYFSRSILRRENGDTRGADADAARAVALDPDYAAILD